MRFIYSLILTAISSIVLQAQNLSINPREIITPVTLEDFEVVGYARLKNNSNQTLTLVWRREIISQHSNWEISICDKNNCYLPHIETRELVLSAGEESNLDVHVRHNGARGNGEIKLLVFDKNNPSDSTSAIYIFTSGTTSTKKVAFGENIKIWPNPAQDYFMVSDSKNIGRIEVLDLLGNQVKSYDPRSHAQFDVSNLNPGIYMVRLISKNDPAKSKTLRLRKI